jgi:hypothetical protein
LTFRAGRAPSAGIVRGTLSGNPGTSYLVELFENRPRATAEGQILAARMRITIGPRGVANFAWSVPQSVPSGTMITATATSSAGDSSEFSAPAVVVGRQPRVGR